MNIVSYVSTSIFEVDAQTIVNTVNCRGGMGAGLAREFRGRYPKMYLDYMDRCSRQEVKIGEPYLYVDCVCPWILNFPTKCDWSKPSKLEWIEAGLRYFVENYRGWGITSVAFPQLGCRNGKLKWNEVQPVMVQYLRALDIPTIVCIRKVD